MKFEIGSKVTARQGGKEMPGTITGRHGSADYYAVRMDNGELIYQWGDDLKQRNEQTTTAQTESKEEKKEMTTLERIAADMKSYYTDRSAWGRGVATIAADLLGEYANNYGKNAAAPTMADLLNGADNWSQYSWGGCYLVYDADIAELLCTPSELKRTRNGERRPNGREEWLDVQARALNQAARRIINSARRVCKEV